MEGTQNEKEKSKDRHIYLLSSIHGIVTACRYDYRISQERFYSEEEPQKNASGHTYHPVKLCAVFDLLSLPTREDFLNTCEPPEEDEEYIEEPTETIDDVEDVQEESFLSVLAGQGE